MAEPTPIITSRFDLDDSHTLDRYEALEDWPKALDVANELISLDTAAVRFYQKRVELSFRLGDREHLVDSYLELGDALLRSGAVDKAIAVYRRVAEHDPGNARAATALRAYDSASGLSLPAKRTQ